MNNSAVGIVAIIVLAIAVVLTSQRLTALEAKLVQCGCAQAAQAAK